MQRHLKAFNLQSPRNVSSKTTKKHLKICIFINTLFSLLKDLVFILPASFRYYLALMQDSCQPNSWVNFANQKVGKLSSGGFILCFILTHATTNLDNISISATEYLHLSNLFNLFSLIATLFLAHKNESVEIVGAEMILCMFNILQHRNVSAAPSAVKLRITTIHFPNISLYRSSVSVAKTNHTQLWRATTHTGMLKHFSATSKLIWSERLP